VKKLGRRLMPVSLRLALGSALDSTATLRTELYLAWLRKQLWNRPPGSLIRFRDHTIRINDGPNAYVGLKDIFVNRIYHFESRRPDPLIIDCGSNIGLSILYFVSTYPSSRVIGFEPDPTILPYLQENIALNGVHNAQLVHAAVSARPGITALHSDGTYGSCLARQASADAAPTASTYDVPCVRLRDYLTETVDFLKMNIEGAEWEVLEDSEDRLSQVQEMIIEYHHLPGLPRTLHHILALLHRQGFEVLINDFDSTTNPGSLPPFRLDPGSRYFLLIYARRLGSSTC
jgi:FkbM family methyltransferase